MNLKNRRGLSLLFMLILSLVSACEQDPVVDNEYEVGESCSEHSQCGSHYCEPTEGKCAEKKDNGVACTSEEECFSGFCSGSSQTCQPQPVEDGGACPEAPATCGEGKYCDSEHKCQQKKENDSECSSEAECLSNYCDTTGNPHVCKVKPVRVEPTLLGVGAECTVHQECQSGWCYDDGENKQCKAKIEAEASCNEDKDVCVEGYSCKFGKCRKDCDGSVAVCDATKEVCEQNACVKKGDLCSVRGISSCFNDKYACVDGECKLKEDASSCELCGGFCCGTTKEGKEQVCFDNACIVPPEKPTGATDLCKQQGKGVDWCAGDSICMGEPGASQCVRVEGECNEADGVYCRLDEFCQKREGDKGVCVKYKNVTIDDAICRLEPVSLASSPQDEATEVLLHWKGSTVSERFKHVMSTPVVADIIDKYEGSEIVFNSYSNKYEDQIDYTIGSSRFKEAPYRSFGVLRVISSKLTDASNKSSMTEIFNSTDSSEPFWTHATTSPALFKGSDGMYRIVVDGFFLDSSPFNSASPKGQSKELLDNHYLIILKVDTDGTVAIEKKIKFEEGDPNMYQTGPQIVNIDGEGKPEIIAGNYIFKFDESNDRLDLFCRLEKGSDKFSATSTADIDGDGIQEIIAFNTIFKYNKDNGKCGLLKLGTPAWEGAVTADINEDGELDLIYVKDGSLHVDWKEGDVWKTLWKKAFPINYEQAKRIAGPSCTFTGSSQAGCDCTKSETVDKGICRPGWAYPIVSDFNGDGKPNIGIATRWHYLVYDNTGEILWAYDVNDYSSAMTSSSVFDFNADGKAEVVYNDEDKIYVFQGEPSTTTGKMTLQFPKEGSPGSVYDKEVPKGKVLFTIENLTETQREYPVIVDVNHDGEANIVAVSNQSLEKERGGPKDVGLKVFKGKKTWAPTRTLWNQFSYRYTNVKDDGTIPDKEHQNWKVRYLNNYFQNVQKGNPFLRPNLKVVLRGIAGGACDSGESFLKFDIVNVGSVKNDKSFSYKVTISDGSTEELLKGEQLGIEIEPGGKESIEIKNWKISDAFTTQGPFSIKIEVDPDDDVQECKENAIPSDNSIVIKGIQKQAADLAIQFKENGLDLNSCQSNGLKIQAPYVVTNNGGASVEPDRVSVRLYAGVTEPNILLCEKTINSEIAKRGESGAVVDGEVECVIPSSLTNQSLKFKWVVNEDSSIVECNMKDNSATRAVTGDICYELG